MLSAIIDGEQSNRPTSDDPATDERHVIAAHRRAIREIAERFGVTDDEADYAVSFYGV